MKLTLKVVVVILHHNDSRSKKIIIADDLESESKPKSIFLLTPNFKDITSSSVEETLFTFGSVEERWKTDAKKLAWNKEDIINDECVTLMWNAMQSLPTYIIANYASLSCL